MLLTPKRGKVTSLTANYGVVRKAIPTFLTLQHVYLFCDVNAQGTGV